MLKSLVLIKLILVLILSLGLTLGGILIEVNYSFLAVYLVTFAFCLGLMEIGVLVVRFLVKKSDLYYFVFCLFFLGLAYSFLLIISYTLDFESNQEFKVQLYLWISLIIIGLFQTVYFWLIKNNQESTRLINAKQSYLQHSFNALKSQNVIEFLKEALKNTIDLIQRDPDLAVSQIEKLTSILRHLLHTRDERFVKLGSELSNAKEYCELAEIQLDNKVNLTINITNDFNETKIPPLVFQMVLDNQVKKFASSNEKELNIEVYIENKKFVVVKTSFLTSFKNNLKNQQFINNLKQRYQLYNKASGVSELSTANDYFVKFPLVIS
ncbi:MAG: hypothetical protein CMD18_04910 [Flavobacteriales bacterium]|nr:hypothetical protein [Flavobacteriales bacterium]